MLVLTVHLFILSLSQNGAFADHSLLAFVDVGTPAVVVLQLVDLTGVLPMVLLQGVVVGESGLLGA